MNTKDKIILLNECDTLGGIFRMYQDYLSMPIDDKNLKVKFFDFLEELLSDGSIILCDYRENPEKILTGKPSEQVDELRKIWPTMEEMKIYFPDNPWYYVEWFWWRATCPIELAYLPKTEIYELGK
ncbi:MAG: DUF596 domain-containing protein [Neisseria sp.]|nr:DUF596 domain-containing protein [Neisseria sp.]